MGLVSTKVCWLIGNVKDRDCHFVNIQYANLQALSRPILARLMETWRKRRRQENENENEINKFVSAKRRPVPFVATRNPAPDVLNVPQLEDLIYSSIGTTQLTREDIKTARSLGQIDKKFIAATCRNGTVLALVDQHAADERVVLEQLWNEAASKPRQSLKLPIPQSLEAVGPEELALLEAFDDGVRSWGWRWSKTSQGLIQVTHVPLVAGKAIPASELRSYINHQQHCKVLDRKAVPSAICRAFASQACRAAIKFGDVLNDEECCDLLGKLKDTQLCFICAHGRPTMPPVVDLQRVAKASARISKFRPTCRTSQTSESLKGLKARLEGYLIHHG
jgi:DNA mismatch repair ATPase MutL